MNRPGWHAAIERKTPQEVALMRVAGRILAQTLAEMQAAVKPGVTTRQVDAVAERTIRAHGAVPAFKNYPGPYPYPAVTTISLNDQMVHGIPGPRVIREGDLVKLDCGVWHKGFYADAAVTVGVGQLSPTAEKLLQVTQHALQVGLAYAKTDCYIGDISAAIQKYVEGEGFQLAREYTGHGIGRHMHEAPEVPNIGEAKTGPKLRPGMVITIEPMVVVGQAEFRTLPDQWTVVTIDGSWTAHFEHTVAIKTHEPEVLTQLATRELAAT